MVSIARSQFDVFRNVVLWDDNFEDGWTAENSAQLDNSDGDILEIEIDTGQTYVSISKDATFYADVDRYIITRCTALTATSWKVYVRRASDSTWLLAATYTNTGIKTTDLDLITKEKCDKIRIRVDGSAGEHVKLDYTSICGKTRLVLSPGDVEAEGEAWITQSLLSSGVSSVKPLKLNNTGGAYTDEIDNNDVLLAYLYWEGDTTKKVFGGRIVEPGASGDADSNEYWLVAEAKGHEEALQAGEQLVQKIYEGTNGKTIITDALSYCTPITDKFVDVDSEITSVHSLEIDEKQPFEIINNICRQAKTIGGVVGFDSYVDPAGNCHVFKRGKYVCTVTPTIQHYDISWDSLRVRNKIKVYGAMLHFNPLDRDSWSESISNWTSDGTLAADNADKQVGSYSIKTTRTAISTYMYYAMASSISLKWPHDYSKLHFWAKVSVSAGTPDYIFVRLSKNADALNYFFVTIENIQADKWMEFEIPIGPKSNMNNYYFGSPNWADINTLHFTFANSQSADLTLKIDEPCFIKNCVGEAEDAVSQDKYGVRCRDPEVDESLTSDLECEKRAESWLDFLKEKTTKIVLVVKGNNGYTPGHKLRVQLSNENVDDWFRILEVKHHLYGVNWDTVLTLSNEPEFIDYVFAMAGAPRKAGASVVVGSSSQEDVDYESLQEAIDVLAS